MPNISGADSARKPPRAMAYAYGFADRVRGDWYHRAGDFDFDGTLEVALQMLTTSPLETLPYVVVRLDDGVEIWARALRSVVRDPSVIEATIAVSDEPGEVLF